MKLLVRLCMLSALAQLFVSVSSFTTDRVVQLKATGDLKEKIIEDSKRGTNGKKFGDDFINKNLSGCRHTAKGKTSCVEVGQCRREEIQYYETKYKSKNCLMPNGYLGECCPKGGVQESRQKRAASNAVVNILEEYNESSKKIDLTKLGDITNCGRSRKVINEKFHGKQETEFSDYPWLVALVIKKIKAHYCGGALIDRKHVLTAAHCVPEGVVPEGILVRIGEYDFDKNETHSYDGVVEKINYHEDYDPATKEHDIAILTLKDNVNYNGFVSPVCLPQPDDNHYKENITAIVAGWGKTMYNGNTSSVLQEVQLPLWDQNTCVYSFSQSIYETALCAAGYIGGLDACQGDSGGPLVTQKDDGRWVTLGVVSWGIKCGERGKPGVYTRVNEYLEWIAENLS
ncbi:proclotting enzyme-like [Cimex lectularius]|uniref:Phenoloxidase-activating factor 2 n=1 Tax=Cimex lectularius TaxID=79782 RepID=A0A8I6RLC7_CIMLE|nr:proclotting enzyme-like [Cimex lectularius]